MKKTAVSTADLRGVFPVPPLARKRDATRTIDWAENARIVSHIHAGGCTRLLYGGNAFLYHITLAEYDHLLEWLAGREDALWMIPSAGPSFGRLMDQAPLLRRYEAVLKKKGSAIARTTDGDCQACHVALPPQLFQKVLRRETFEECPMCHRILYFWSEAAP